MNVPRILIRPSRFLGIALLLLCSRCQASDAERMATLSLLPATSSGRVEAAVRIPQHAQLEVACRRIEASGETPEPVRVWLHRDQQRGEQIQTIPFNTKGTAAAMVDLSRYSGDTCFLRITAGGTAVTWQTAALHSLSPAGDGDPWRVPPVHNSPDVLLYLVDTLRSDVVGAYAGPGPTPNMDQLARNGTLFERAYASSTWTRPSVASLFSGLPVSAHQTLTENEALPEEVLTLAERFRLRGYETIGVVANAHVSETYDFDQGFETYVWLPMAPKSPARRWRSDFEIGKRSAQELHDAVIELLGKRSRSGRPLFLYVHTIDPHNPYEVPRWHLAAPRPDVNANNYLFKGICEGEFASTQLLSQLALQYRGAVAYADRELGSFLARLAGHIDPSRMITVLTSDHGEAFFEHRLVGHQHWPHEELIRIPLIMSGPGVPAGLRDTVPASLDDVVPTVMRLIQPEATAGFTMGVDLFARSEGPSERRGVYSEHTSGCVLVDGEWKLGWHRDFRDDLSFSLFNIRHDPGEHDDMVALQSDKASAIEQRFRRWRAAATELRIERSAAREPGDEVMRQLKAIGYLN